MEAYFKRPKRSLMQILEEDRKLYAKYSGEMQEALLAMRVRDYQLYGDNPLMWDRAKQFRAIEVCVCTLCPAMQYAMLSLSFRNMMIDQPLMYGLMYICVCINWLLVIMGSWTGGSQARQSEAERCTARRVFLHHQDSDSTAGRRSAVDGRADAQSHAVLSLLHHTRTSVV
jgi:hypothetical protein